MIIIIILVSLLASIFYWSFLRGHAFTLLFRAVIYTAILTYAHSVIFSLELIIALDISVSLVCFIILMLTNFVIRITLRSTNSPRSAFLWSHWFIWTALLLVFFFKRTLLYFVFCEIRLIPISLIILGWGYQPERSLAFMYIFMYTFCSAIPLLLILLTIGVTEAGWNLFQFNFFISLRPINLWSLYRSILIFLTMSAFLVKFPIYGVHLWLPKAHVEAPLTGSMILAGLLLKLGGFRWFLLNPLLRGGLLSIFLSSFRGLGAVVVRFICLRQIDIKVLIAYSSVAHLGIVIIAFSSGRVLSFIGGLFIIVAHGFSSPGIFYGANNLYLRSNSRNVLLNSRIIQFMPTITLFWFLLCMANISAPPSRNLVSEMIAIRALINIRLRLALQISFLVFLGGAYTLVLYSSSQQGQKKPKFSSCFQTRPLEFHIWALLVCSVYGLRLMLIII